MDNLEAPQVISAPVASSSTALKNQIPDEPTGSYLASVQEGFPPITMLPQEQGGEAPDGKDFNGLFNLMSQFYYYTQNGGTYTFVPEVSDAIGGYPENALLWYFPQECTAQWLRSTKPNNTDNFIANPEVIGTSWVEQNTRETGFPVGLIIPAVGFVEDVNFKLLDGSTLSQTGIYSQFATIVKAKTAAGDWPSCTDEEFEEEVANTGQCGCFVIDNTANTIRLPLITRFIGGITSPSDIGKTLQDQFQGHEHLTTPTDGGFNSRGGGEAGTGRASNFSSTRTSLGIIENQTDGLPRTGSETYPTHTKYPYYIVVANSSIKEPITVDINQIIGDLESKADIDLENVNALGKNLIASLAMPDYSSQVTKTTPFTAEFDCYVHCLLGTNIAFGTTQLLADGIIVDRAANQTNNTNNVITSLSGFIPKGAVVTITGGASTTVTCFVTPLKGAINV